MRWFAALALWFLAAPAMAASFDCAKATTDMEIAICGDPVLSEWDERIAMAYNALDRSGRYYQAYRADQRNWLRNERSADAYSFEYRFQNLTMAGSLLPCLEGEEGPDLCIEKVNLLLDRCMSEGQYTTLAMNACSGQLAAVWDIVLKVEGDRLAEEFAADPKTQDLFRKSETAFAAYREADCGWQFSAYRDGTIRGQIYLGCYLRHSEQRAKALLAEFSHR